MTSIIRREMGLTHAEFFRTLPAALGGQAFQRAETTVTVQDGSRRVTIRLGPQEERRIALLHLPVTGVTFEFAGYAQGEIEAFMRTFERHFQRGGG